METNTIATNTPNTGLSANLKSLTAEQTTAAAISTEKSMDINLVTAEGDKVTISLDAKMAALYGSYQKVTMDESGYSSQSTRMAYNSYEREMTFTVEGDLNEDERKDIAKALKSLDRMMNQFVNGQLKPMLATAEKMKGLDTIAELEATMSYKREIVQADQTNVTVVTGTPAPVDGAVQPAVGGQQVDLAQLAEKADAVGDAMADKIKSNQARIDRMMAFFERLMDDYRGQMKGFNKLGTRMIDRIADRVNEALSQYSDTSDSVEQGAEV